MPQKWTNTIPFGSGHTLGTFNHGLEPLFCCFITHFGVGSSLVAHGAPWRPPGPPGTPLTPGMSSLAIHNHPGSLWVIFDPSGVSNWGVSLLCIAVHCSALQCNFALFAFFVFFVLFFYFFCMIWFHTIILKPNKYKNHLFIAKTNEWILAPFISIHTTPPHI